jgi:hypothetical protein
MAGAFMVAFALFGAGIVDATRLFTVRAEMQTVADAAALAGAIQMLRDSSQASDTALGYARRNGARMTGTTPDSVGVTSGVWSPSIGAFLPGGDPSDAIRVGVARTVPFVLAQLIGGTGVRMSVSATAWSSAPVNGSSGCMKPLVLPYDYLRRLVDSPSSTMTLDDMRKLRELTVEERTDTFSFGWSGESTNDNYFLAHLPPVDPATGEPLEEPQGNFYDHLTQCLSSRVSAGDWLALGARGTHRQELLAGLEEFCENALDDGGLGGEFAGGSCFIGGVVVPMPLKVAFWESQPDWGFSTHGGVEVKTLGMFNVTRVDPLQVPNPQWSPEDTYDVPTATIAGYVSMERDQGRIGNQPSTLRRPMIVE